MNGTNIKEIVALLANLANLDASNADTLRKGLVDAANKFDELTRRMDTLRECLDDQAISPETCIEEVRKVL